jgi:hypothetical protein
MILLDLFLWGSLAGGLALALVVLRRRPRADRDWAADHARPARAVFDNGHVHLHDLRDFQHPSPAAFVERYQDLRLALDEVEGVWLVLAPFARPRFRPLAHTFVSFELRGGRFVAISVEARRELDETYSLIGGLLRRFELTYVVGTERDVIGLRARRGDTLYLYPVRASARGARALFTNMLKRADRVRARPEFYNTLTNNCATNLRRHLAQIDTRPVPWGWGIVFPGLLDRLALSLGLLDTDLPLAAARVRFRVDPPARAAVERDDPDFSARIRTGLAAEPDCERGQDP